ncbi:MAG: galactose-1-phosphate uridylyltransferase [Candidatus Heimdallarchaeaceae archaeon]
MNNNEMRYNPFLEEWVIYSPSRQKRPDRDTTKCPFCEGSTEVPSFEGPMRIANKFPALSLEAGLVQYSLDELHIKRGAFGVCEVLIYSAEHEKKFTDLTENEILAIFSKWTKATKELSKHQAIKYILPFENYGEDVGASITHPHGQIYAFPFVPKIIENELRHYKEYFEKKKSCFMCDYVRYELKVKDRVVYSDDYIVALVPYYAQYAYDIYIYPKRCYGLLSQSTRKELEAFASFLPQAIKALNSIFGKEVSYSLSLHQSPLNVQQIRPYHLYFKLHTPQRNKQSLKILGAVESSLGIFLNGMLPEAAAKEIRQAIG